MNQSRAETALKAVVRLVVAALSADIVTLAAVPGWVSVAIGSIGPHSFHTSYARQRRGRAA